MSGRDPLHLWPLTKGFVMPFILPILGFIYGVNSAEGRASLDIIVLSIFGAPIIAVGFLSYEYYTEQRSMMYGTMAALFLMILFIFGLFSS
ncbi:MAG: hypothetical protein CMA92_05400 [Euryarchaeota archaeon]|nr:hypothetical protein [Euryarchaeota archaeon]|tara:strand:+ start:1510 stop:1782 length:273 start_codon:yes stop_codon:yes gene_type:complete